jgi:hypothetical protein
MCLKAFAQQTGLFIAQSAESHIAGRLSLDFYRLHELEIHFK